MNTQIAQGLTRLSAYSEQHLAEVECDLAQLDALQAEAIKKLFASFIAIHEAVNEQQQMLEKLLHAGGSLAEYAVLMQATQAEVSHHTREAVAGLQFQDMTSQLIGRMASHLSRLREVLSALDLGEVPPHEDTHHHFSEKLNALHERVAAHCTAMPGGLRNTVHQRHMNSGEVELF